jgi:tungstate transport system ATP-binding protein
MPEPIYHLEDVIKTYGHREILNIPRLEIMPGEVLGIIGPSGAGKSTLLRLLNFLETPTRGQIHFNGYSTDGQHKAPLPVRRRVATLLPFNRSTGTPNGTVGLALRRQVTTVFQRPVLLRTTVYNNVAYGLKIRGEKNIDERVMEALERVGLAEFARMGARTLSGGEAQRVALARALVIEPQVLLLDEPTANLDPYNVGLIEDIVSALNREKGTTIVLVTHNVFQARRLAHRAALLLEGRIVEVGECQRVFAAPADPRTAAFVRGDMVY